MSAGFVATTIYVGPGTTLNQLLWDTVGDGTGNKIPGTLLRNAAGTVAVIDAGGNLAISDGGSSTTSVASGAANTVVKASAGRLCRAVVTTTGTGSGNVQFFDNATTNSGVVIGAIPATVTAGATYDFSMPASAGITVQNVANGPVITVSFT